MVRFPPPTVIWRHCRDCDIRLTREAIDIPTPSHEAWCTQRTPWRRMVHRLLDPYTESGADVYGWHLWKCWSDFSERLCHNQGNAFRVLGGNLVSHR